MIVTIAPSCAGRINSTDFINLDFLKDASSLYGIFGSPLCGNSFSICSRKSKELAAPQPGLPVVACSVSSFSIKRVCARGEWRLRQR